MSIQPITFARSAASNASISCWSNSEAPFRKCFRLIVRLNKTIPAISPSSTCRLFPKRAKTRTPMKCEIISHFKQLIVANNVTMNKPRFFQTRENLTVSF